MREDDLQSWFPDDQDQLQSENLNASGVLLSNADLLGDHLDKMDENAFDNFGDLEMFEHYSESTPSTGPYNNGTAPSEISSSKFHADTKNSTSDYSVIGQRRETTLENMESDIIRNGTTGSRSRVATDEFALPGQSSTFLNIKRSGSEDVAQNISTIADSLGQLESHSPGTDQPSRPLKRGPKRAQVHTGKDSLVVTAEYRARSSIPLRLSWMEFARQGILAAYSSRLNPYALHPGEYELLRSHITKQQVTVYINIRNAILRLWHRNPLVAVTKQEAAGCVKEGRYFPLAMMAFEWLLRNGYINFGCVDLPLTSLSSFKSSSKTPSKQKTIIVIGAGMSGLGCARHLEHMVHYLSDEFSSQKELPPRIIVLEGRRRIGGRVFSHPLKKQGNLPLGMRSTAEMGAQIVTGFDHGNPLSVIIRGQLAIPYHPFRDINSPLYDCDGEIVDREKDIKVERLWNDILERASVFRNKLPTARTVPGERPLIIWSEDPKESIHGNDVLLSTLEDAGENVTIDDGNLVSKNTEIPENSAVGVEKLAGRQYTLVRHSAKLSAAQASKDLGWELKSHVEDTDTLDLLTASKQSSHPTLGETLDEGIRQYQEMVNLTAQDLRLLNWHHANLEYANAANLDDLSLGGWDQDIGNEFEGHHSEIIGGYTQVPRGLWRLPHPLDVRFEHSVERIRYSNSSSPGKKSLVQVECSNGQTLQADRLVLTTPLGVLKHGAVDFVPPLPEWKTSCIDRMGFGLLNKVILVYDQCFWEEDMDIFGLLNQPNSPTMDQRDYSACRGRFYLFWNCIKTSGRPVLIALMAGAAAHQAEEADNESLVEDVTNRLSKMFAPKRVPRPAEVIVTRWKRDPFARGTYSYVGPRTQPGDYDVMARPCGPIHFAGEATCGTHPATVHGAYLSGLRAASEVIESLVGPIRLPQSPLVQAKSHKAAASQPTPTPKRKFGYIDVWEPIDKPDPFYASIQVDTENDAYEARIASAVLAAVGARPPKPTRAKLNPYIIYSKEEWKRCKAQLDAQKAAKTTGNAGAKATKDEIRSQLGLQWRQAPESIKQPYIDRCRDGRDENSSIMDEYNKRVAEWDARAQEAREEFVRENKPPASFSSGRKSRKHTSL